MCCVCVVVCLFVVLLCEFLLCGCDTHENKRQSKGILLVGVAKTRGNFVSGSIENMREKMRKNRVQILQKPSHVCRNPT